MDSTLLVGVLLATSLVVGWIVFLRQGRQRRERLSRWAAVRGFVFRPERDDSLVRQLPQARFQEGENHSAYNVVTGSDGGRLVVALDCRYVTPLRNVSGRRWASECHRFSAVTVQAAPPLEPLVIRSASFFDKVDRLFGGNPVAFDSPEFNRQFYVTSPDHDWARRALSPAAMEFLLQSPRFTLECNGYCVVGHRGDRLLSPDDFEAAIALISGLLDRIAPDVRREPEAADAAEDSLVECEIGAASPGREHKED
jgi:hypothetical protein